MEKIKITERGLFGALAKFAVQQSPYHRPEGLEAVLDNLNISIGDAAFKNYFIEFPSFIEAEKWLRGHLNKIPQFLAWNERKNGNKSQYKFVDRYSGDGNPDDDFIDLDALIRNVISEASNL